MHLHLTFPEGRQSGFYRKRKGSSAWPKVTATSTATSTTMTQERPPTEAPPDGCCWGHIRTELPDEQTKADTGWQAGRRHALSRGSADSHRSGLWPEPFTADSGRGGYTLLQLFRRRKYRPLLPNTPE